MSYNCKTGNSKTFGPPLACVTHTGYTPLSSEAALTITVKNRNTPVFARQFYSVQVPENVELDSAVLDVEAESMTGKKIIYSISAGNIYGEFDIVFDLGQY